MTIPTIDVRFTPHGVAVYSINGGPTLDWPGACVELRRTFSDQATQRLLCEAIALSDIGALADLPLKP